VAPLVLVGRLDPQVLLVPLDRRVSGVRPEPLALLDRRLVPRALLVPRDPLDLRVPQAPLDQLDPPDPLDLLAIQDLTE
jgi:hypothetical protein